METAIKVAMAMALTIGDNCECPPGCDCPGSRGGVCDCAEKAAEKERAKPPYAAVENESWFNKETWLRYYNYRPESDPRVADVYGRSSVQGSGGTVCYGSGSFVSGVNSGRLDRPQTPALTRWAVAPAYGGVRTISVQPAAMIHNRPAVVSSRRSAANC